MSFTDKIRLFWSGIWDFIEPFIKILLTGAGQILADVAMKAVLNVAKDISLVTDDSKRQAAFATIVVDLQARGIQLATSTINLALEAAVVKMKAGKV